MLVNIAPFGLLLVLWFYMMRSMKARKQAAPGENSFGTPQQMASADVVSELRSLRQSVDALRADIKAIDERTGR